MSAADDAWQAFKLSVPPEVYPTYEDTFMAAYRSGYRRALQDAADDICTTKGCGRRMSEHEFGVFCP